jgi:tRNA A-37 threonylcarbamoyl transferase component Bud32
MDTVIRPTSPMELVVRRPTPLMETVRRPTIISESDSDSESEQGQKTQERKSPEPVKYSLKDMVYEIDESLLNLQTPYDNDLIKIETDIALNSTRRNNFVVYDGDSKDIIPCANYTSFNDIRIARNYESISIYSTEVGDKSTAGSLYITCIVQNRNKTCDYITKVIDVIEKSPALISYNYDGERNLRLNYNAVRNEIKIQMKASELGIAPRIIDVFYCNDFLKDKQKRYIKAQSVKDFYLCQSNGCFITVRRFFIVMEKLDITVEGFLKYFNSELRESYRQKIGREIRSELTTLHKNNIIHGDFHLSNCMLNITAEGKRYFADLVEATKKGKNVTQVIQSILRDDVKKSFFGTCYTVKIIDFGRSIDFSDTKLTGVNARKFEMLKKADFLDAE